MNRGKFWLYMALTLVAGIANLVVVSRALTQRALDDLDREQRAAATQIDARAQLLAADAERLAEAVGRDPATIQALSPDAPGAVDAAAASRAALDAARTMGLDASRPLLVATSGRGGRGASVAGEPVRLQRDDTIFPAAGAARREGYARTERGVWYVVAVAVGRGAAVGIGMPVDATWLASLKGATGSDLTLIVEGRKPLSTLSARDMAVVEAAARAKPLAPLGAGVLGRDGPPTATMPLLFASAPAFRVHALALKGASGSLALARSAAPLLAPLATYQWTMLGALLALALVGLAVGLLITNEQAALVPKALTNAADRISRGDFAARAPIMAGSLGTIAAALNRAAEAAEAAARPPPAWEAPTSQLAVSSSLVEGPTEQLSPAETAPERSETTPLAGHEWVPSREAQAEQEIGASGAGAQGGEVSAAAETPPAEAAPTPAELASRADGASAFADGGLAQAAAEDRGAVSFEPTMPLGRDEGAAADTAREAGTGDLLAAAAISPQEAAGAQMSPPPEAAAASMSPSLEAAAAPTPAMADEPAPPTETAAAPMSPPPEPAVPAPAPASTSPISTADEDHWSSVYQEFIKVRRDCGESAEGVPYPRFRNKLQQNRDNLVAKYGCRTVRFQVYVKQGKAALKASPVR